MSQQQQRETTAVSGSGGVGDGHLHGEFPSLDRFCWSSTTCKGEWRSRGWRWFLVPSTATAASDLCSSSGRGLRQTAVSIPDDKEELRPLFPA
nr:hypothetical protein Itr_chr12CG17320 [Ipomoea trifida]